MNFEAATKRETMNEVTVALSTSAYIALACAYSRSSEQLLILSYEAGDN